MKYPPEEVESRRWQKIADELGNRTAKQVRWKILGEIIPLFGFFIFKAFQEALIRYNIQVSLQCLSNLFLI